MSQALRFTDLQLLASQQTAAAAMRRGEEELFGPGDNETDDLHDYDEILRLTQRPGTKKGTRRLKATIPKPLLGLMGEANRAFVERDWAKSEACCVELIKQAPFSIEPYTTLAMVYEATENFQKAFHIRKIESACIPRGDVDWRALAKSAIRCDEPEEARHFLDEDIRAHQNTVSSLQLQVQLLVELKQWAMCLERLGILGPQQPRSLQFLQVLSHVVSLIDGDDRTELVLEAALIGEKCMRSTGAESLTEEHVRVGVGLFLAAGAWENAIHYIARFCKFCLHAVTSHQSQDVQPTTMFGWPVPARLSLFMRVKLVVCHLHLSGGDDYALPLAQSMEHEDPAEHFVLFVEVIDALMLYHHFHMAIELLDLVMEIPANNKPFFWIKKGICMLELSRFDEAEQFLQAALKIMPTSTRVLHSLVRLYHYWARPTDEAFFREQALTFNDASELARLPPPPRVTLVQPAGPVGRSVWRNPTTQTAFVTTSLVNAITGDISGVVAGVSKDAAANSGDDVDDVDGDDTSDAEQQPMRMKRQKNVQMLVADLRIEFQRFLMHWMDENHAAVVDSGRVLCTLFLTDMIPNRKCYEHPLPADVYLSYAGVGVKKVQQLVFSTTTDGRPIFFSSSTLPTQEWIVVFTRTCEALLLQGGAGLTEVLAFLSRALSVEDFNANDHVACAWLWLTAVAHAKRQDVQAAVAVLRVLSTERGFGNSVRLWNFYFEVTKSHLIKEGNAHRVFNRLLVTKTSSATPLQMAVGHHHLSSGFYSYAAALYIMACKQRPDDPLVNLCTGVAYLRLAVQRKTEIDRHRTILYGFAFFRKYFRLCGESEEACFNMARAFHQLRLYHLAQPYYERVLDGAGASTNKYFVRLAAFNMSRIFKETGQPGLARQMLMLHCRV